MSICRYIFFTIFQIRIFNILIFMVMFFIPLDIIHSLAITAKIKLETNLTDVPFAVTDSELL